MLNRQTLAVLGCVSILGMMPFIAGCLGAAVFMFSSRSGQPPDSAYFTPVRTDTVSMATNRFLPPTVEVLVGGTVRWTNDDTWQHNVVFRRSVFPASPYLDGGEEFTTTFETPGTYQYACSLHAGMIGWVIVVRPTN